MPRKRTAPQTPADTTIAGDDDRPAMFYAEVPLEFERRLRAADGTTYADGAAEAPEDAEEVFEIVISSETPATYQGARLVLSHDEAAIDMSIATRGLSLLLEHGGRDAPWSIDPELHVGVVENIRIVKNQLVGTARFGPSARAQQTREEFRARVRPFISVGWLPLAEPVLLKAGGRGTPDTYVMKRWRPCEASSVSVPKDPKARHTNSVRGFQFPAGHPGGSPAQEGNAMKKVLSETGTVIEVLDDDPRPALSDVQLRSLAGMVVRGGDGPAPAAQEARNKEIGEILTLCTLHGMEKRAGEFVAAGLTLEQAKGRILDLRSSSGDFAGAPAAERLVPFSRKEAEQYSVVRAVQCALALRGVDGFKFEGLEADVHRHLERLAKIEGAAGLPISTRGGVFVPMRARDAAHGDEKLVARLGGETLQLRAASTMGPSIAGGGAEIVPNVLLDMIDILRNNSVCTTLGARTLPGMVGTATWPRRKADPTVRWMGTNPGAGAAASGSQYGWVMSSPKTLIGNVVYPRQLGNMVNFDLENDIRGVLGEGHALAWDLGGIAGTGTDNQPVGITNNPDVQTLAMGNTIPTYKLLVQAVGMVRKKNFRAQRPAWVTTPEMAAVLAATPRVDGAGATDFIWQGPVGDGLIAGYRAMDSNQMPIDGSANHETVVGVWQNMVFPLWGAMEITVDPYSFVEFGQLRIASFQMGDVVNQRPEGFVRCTGARLV